MTRDPLHPRHSGAIANDQRQTLEAQSRGEAHRHRARSPQRKGIGAYRRCVGTAYQISSRGRIARIASGSRLPRLLLMSPPQAGSSRPLVRGIVARRQALVCKCLSAMEPSFCHAPPSLPVLGLARGFGHQFAFGGMLQEFIRRIERDHYSLVLFFTPRSPGLRIQTFTLRASGS